jgi:hypothetical protein
MILYNSAIGMPIYAALIAPAFFRRKGKMAGYSQGNKVRKSLL